VTGAIAVYRRTISVPLRFDDNSPIADNLSIRRLWPLGNLHRGTLDVSFFSMHERVPANPEIREFESGRSDNLQLTCP